MQPNVYLYSAKYYDFLNESHEIEGDIDFYKDLIPSDANVLDVGCGTGRVSIILAKRGNDVTGIDLSESMLVEFENKIAQNPDIADKIRLHLSNMADFHLGQTFDWIIFPWFSFLSLKSDEDRKKCLSCVKEHINDKSRAILTLFNPDKSILDNWEEKKNTLGLEKIDENSGRKIRRYDEHDFHDGDNQVISVRYRWEVFENDVLVDTVHDRIEIGYMYPDQCKRLFEEAGFEIEAAYSDYQKRPFIEDEKKKQIYVIKKR